VVKAVQSRAARVRSIAGREKQCQENETARGLTNGHRAARPGAETTHSATICRQPLVALLLKIEIRSPGYQPLDLNLKIMPGRTVNYRSELRK
jgi:hypothetical protein